MATDGLRLLARGAAVVLKDGVERRLILDMEALAVIEERMGSLSAYSEGLNRAFRGKRVTSTLAGLEAGLSHLRDDYGVPAFSRKRVAALMEFGKLDQYIAALDDAWAAHLPVKQAGNQSKGSGRARSSRGKNSSGEQPSTTAEAKASSSE